MNELFRTKNETWKKIQSNLLFIGVAELLIYNGGLVIKYLISAGIDFFTPIVGPDYALYYNANFWMLIPVILALAFMWLTCPGALKALTEGSLTRKLRSLFIGLVLGILAMGLLTLLAVVSGTMTFRYDGFEWQLFPVMIPLFIQCSAEEILLRAYVPAVVGEKHSWDVVCFVSGTLFIFHHIFNMMNSGFSGMFCLNVFLLGVLFCLLVWKEGNFWIAAGIHTGWNYVQSYIFSIEASGSPGTIGAFRGILNHANGFFHDSYGYEGSLSATVIVSAAILWLIYSLNKEGKLDTK
jgi:membrane protease YdiL (CAAX protease family)